MALEKFLHSVNRRTFLKAASWTGIAGFVSPGNLFASLAPSQLSRVAIIDDATATSGLSINAGVVQVMVDSGVKALTGLNDIGDAWKTIFQGINASNVIAIKVNCINSNMPTHPEVTYAVTEGLKQMSFGGGLFPENNIIIYDNWGGRLLNAGYDINTSGTGVRCYATNGDYSTEMYDVNGVNVKLSRIITEEADYLINISVLKNHSGGAGITLCLKNHQGSNNNPDALHGNHCDPFVPALNALSPIRGKQCINICDALFGTSVGGEMGTPEFAANTIVMSKDIVTVDYWGREILKDNGCTSYDRSHYIDTAASAPYNLGTNDPGQMDVVNVHNPTPVEENSWGSIKSLFR